MKGVLFDVMCEVVETNFGAAVWDEILVRARVDGAYTSLADYPDEEFDRVLLAAAQVIGRPRRQLLVDVGTAGFALIAARHRALLTGYESWREVVTQLDGIIHPEVRKIYPHSRPPEFRAAEHEDRLELEYHSHRSMCALADGMVRGAAQWFHESVDVEHLLCTERGDATCLLVVRRT